MYLNLSPLKPRKHNADEVAVGLLQSGIEIDGEAFDKTDYVRGFGMNRLCLIINFCLTNPPFASKIKVTDHRAAFCGQ